jgi:simple sugar transport system ATP-binding protein
LLDLKTMQRESLKGIRELGIMLNDAEEPVANLSGGEQKALAIARSLYFGVQVLILDEPTAALSVAEQGIVLEVVKSLREKGVAVVFISHNIYHAYSVADHFVVLAAGRKLLDVEKKDVSPEQLIKAIIGDKARITAEVVTPLD